MAWYFINPFCAQQPMSAIITFAKSMHWLNYQFVCSKPYGTYISRQMSEVFTLLQRVLFRISVSTDHLHLDVSIDFSVIFILISSVIINRCVFHAHIFTGI
jgi:hypothetical protein